MDRNLTLQNLIAFAYNETEILETVQVVDAIDNDDDTKEDYQTILAAKALFDSATFEPSQGILNKIVLYSQQKNLVHSVS